jgi:2-polyprenyl-6-methoxyphenol hydroxylase-like FAD-dependent oxidoreductase
MYPNGSNGAAQASLDARCLARCLAEQPVGRALAAYDSERRARTTEIVLSNRKGGPERVLDVVSARAPSGFERLEDVINPAELNAIRGQYAAIAGFALSQAKRQS